MPALTDKQKADLKKHVDKVGGTPAEKKSHRMKMISRMSRGMSLAKAHKDIAESQKKLVKDAKKFVKKNEGKRYGAIKNPAPADYLKEAAKEILPNVVITSPKKETDRTVLSSDGDILKFKVGSKEINVAERDRILDRALLKNTALVQSKDETDPDKKRRGIVSKSGFDEAYFKARLPEAWESYTRNTRDPRPVKLSDPYPPAADGSRTNNELTFLLSPEHVPSFESSVTASAPQGKIGKGKGFTASGTTGTTGSEKSSTTEDTYNRRLVYNDNTTVPASRVLPFLTHLARFGSADKALSRHARARLAKEA